MTVNSRADRRLVLWVVEQMSVIQLFALFVAAAAGLGALVEWATGMHNGLLAALDGVGGVWPKAGAAFLLVALALILLHYWADNRLVKWTATTFGVVVILMGLFSVAEWMMDRPLAVDKLLAGGATLEHWKVPVMAATVMVILGIAVLAMVRQRVLLVQTLGGGLVLVAAVIYTAYLFGVSTFYSPALLGPTAPTMVGVILALAIGLLCANPEQGFTRLWIAPGAGGNVARRLVPVVILVPGLLMGLILTVIKVGILDDFGAVILLAAATVAVELAIFWWMATRLERMDRARAKATLALQESNQALEIKVSLRTAELEKSRAKMASIVGSADALIGVDEAGLIVLANRRAERLLDQPEKELLGQPIASVMTDTGWEKQVRLMKGEAEDQEEYWPVRETKEVEARRGTVLFPVEIIVNPVEVEEGILVLIAVRDITTRREAELARQAQQEEAERSNEELEQFARAASHDLKEPLRMVQGYVQLLKKRYKGQLDSEADEFIDLAVDGAERMRALIDDILQYSRIRLEPKAVEPSNCNDAVERALLNLRAAITETEALVEVGELPWLGVESSQLTMLMQNLIGNALKYRAKDVRPQVKVNAHQEGTDWKIEVTDNGIGIEEQYFERVFGLFQRLHTRVEYSGTGVGLALCGRIVELAGGKIGVTSVVGQGSTFWFSLPGVSPVVIPSQEEDNPEMVLVGVKTGVEQEANLPLITVPTRSEA